MKKVMKKNKKNKKKMQFGNTMDIESNYPVNPWMAVDNNAPIAYPQQDYVQIQNEGPFVTDNNQLQPSQTASTTQQPSKGFSKIGGGMAAIGQAAGQVFGDVISGAPQFLNALIPEDQPRTKQYVPQSYNPYPQGTGSQAIYEDGGYITKKRRQGNIQITEEIPEQFAYDQMAPIDLFGPTPIEPLNLPQVAVPQPKSVGYEPLYDERGDITTYLPQFNNFNYNESQNFLQQNVPDYLYGLPVQKTPYQIREFNQNYFPGSESSDWVPFKNGGSLPHQNVPELSEGKMQPLYNNQGQLVTMQPIYQNQMQYEEMAEKVGMRNKGEYTPTAVKQSNFGKGAFDKNKKENGGIMEDEMDLSPEEISNLIAKGYQIEFINEGTSKKRK